MALKIKTKNLLSNVAILVLFLCAFGGIITNVIPFFNAYRSLYILLGILLLLPVTIIRKQFAKALDVSTIFAIVTIPIVIRNNYYLQNGTLSVFLVYIASVSILVSSRTVSEVGIQFGVRLIKLFGIWYATMTYITFLSSDFYFNVIYPLFPDTQASLLRQYNSGYMPGATNHYSTNAMYLAIALGCYAIDYLSTFKKNYKNLVGTIFILGALLLTGKRAHVFFSIIALVIVYYLSQDSHKRGRILRIMKYVLFAVMGVGIASIFMPSVLNVIIRTKELLNSDDFSYGRNALSAFALKLFSQEPILGYGWGQYQYLHSIAFNDRAVYHAHNVFAQLLAETGVIGLAIFTSMFVYNLVQSIKVFLRAVHNNSVVSKKVLTYTGLSVFYQLFFLIYCLTGNPLYDTVTVMIYYFVVMTTVFYQKKFLKINKDKL